jgi:hypothetical protein
MKQPLFDFNEYFVRRAQALNNLGIACLTINKFLNHNLNSDEPWPPSKSFFDKVKQTITKDKFPNYIVSPDDSLTPASYVSMDSVETEKRVSDIGMATVARKSHRKRVRIDSLIKLAEMAFIHAQTYFQAAGIISNPPDYKPPEEVKAFRRLSKKSFADADTFVETASQAIGYWTRIVEEMRKKEKESHAANIKRTRDTLKKKQRVIEIFLSNAIIDRKMFKIHPYKVATEVIKAWVPSDPKDKSPDRESIIKWVREEIQREKQERESEGRLSSDSE